MQRRGAHRKGRKTSWRSKYTYYVVGGVVILSTTAWVYLKRLNAVKKYLNIILEYDFDTSRLEYLVRIRFQNPIQQTVRIVDPSFRLVYKGVVVASSPAQNRELVIPAMGQAQTQVRVGFNLSNLATKFPDLVASLLSRSKVDIQAQALTYYLGPGGLRKLLVHEETWKLGY